jgi:menaquinone-dependent protoporphyrinogen oxidase
MIMQIGLSIFDLTKKGRLNSIHWPFRDYFQDFNKVIPGPAACRVSHFFISLPVQYPVRIIMSTRILVAYASPRGSTAGIAQAIGKEMQSAGYSVDVVELKAVFSLEGYQAVVIGGPIYMGKIVGDVGKFVGKFRETLMKMPVAAFTVGMAPVGTDPAVIDKTMKIFHAALAPLEPVAETIFAGRVEPEKLSFIQKWMINKAKAPVGDFRDWDAIADWAKELPGKLKVERG